MFNPRFTNRYLFASFLSAVLAASCGLQGGAGTSDANASNDTPDSGTQGGAYPATMGDFLISEASVDSLFAFSAVLDEVRLIREDGTMTANYLAGEVELELIHLDQQFHWLARTDVPAGDYESVLVSFVPDSYRAKANDGTPYLVEALSDELIADFVIPTPLIGQPYQRFEVELNLRSSLSRGLEEGTLIFDPEGLAASSDGRLPAVLDGVMGLVRLRDTGTGLMEADVYADQLLEVPITRAEVYVPETTLLVNNNNFVLQYVPYFFTFLIPGSTILDLHGTLGEDGIVRTSRVEIEDQVPIVGQVFPVKLEGRIFSFISSTVFEFEIRNIDRGGAIVGNYLGNIGNPRTVDVAIAPQLNLYFVDGNRLADASELRAGLDVTIKFSSFNGEPFLATRMDIADPYPGFLGEITDLSGLPSWFEMQLVPGEPAIAAGMVESDQTGVTVFLSGSELFLNTHDWPELEPGQLVEGLIVEVRGSLQGPAVAPSLLAERVRVVPGELIGARVVGTLPGNSSFNSSGGIITFTFGEELTPGIPGNLQLLIDDDATFRGAAGTEASFFNLYDTLPPGELLWVDVAGVATGAQQQLTAFEIVTELGSQ